MMKKALFVRAALDGVVQSIVFAFYGAFLISVYATGISLGYRMLIGVVAAIGSAGICVLLMQKAISKKEIVAFAVGSTLCFILGVAIALAIRLTFSLELLPLRVTNNADGLVLLFGIGCFIAASLVLRACIFAVLLVSKGRFSRH